MRILEGVLDWIVNYLANKEAHRTLSSKEMLQLKQDIANNNRQLEPLLTSLEDKIEAAVKKYGLRPGAKPLVRPVRERKSKVIKHR